MFRTIIITVSKSFTNIFIKQHKPPSLGRWNRGDKKFIDYYDNCFTVSPGKIEDTFKNKNNDLDNKSISLSK